MVGGSGGVRANMTGTGGKDGTGLSPLPSGLQQCCRLIRDFPLMSPTVEDGGFVWLRVLPLQVCGSGLN